VSALERVYDVVGVGTNSVDEVVSLPVELAAAVDAGKARVADRVWLCGGQTATVTAACAGFGLASRYIGAFGADERGALAERALLERGVDLSRAVRCDAPNRSAVILVDPRGRRTVLWHRSDTLRVPPAALQGDALRGRVVHVDDDDPETALAAARQGRVMGASVTSDLEHAFEGAEALVAAVTHPIFDQRLASDLTGEGDPERALRKLRRLNDGLLCVTLGEQGSAALDADSFHHAPAFAVEAVDTTGAGDVFRAGFIYGLLRGWRAAELLKFANAAAAVSCTKAGAIPSAPTLEDVDQFLKRR
jgi:sugar/nucleoside kinase (ribokinase family)